MAWIILNRGPVGIGDQMDGPFDIIWGFAEFVLPLAVLEIYLRTTDRSRASARAKAALAGALFVLTVVTGTGIVGAFLHMWLPHL
jgi:hypothetical protein